jgi:hypothetical protein
LLVELAAVRAERDQLQRALASRVVIEQAKGVVAERNRIVPDEAFEMLRDHARRGNLVLRDVCAAVVDGLAHVDSPVLSAPRKATRPPSHRPAAGYDDAPPMPGPGQPPPGH